MNLFNALILTSKHLSRQKNNNTSNIYKNLDDIKKYIMYTFPQLKKKNPILKSTNCSHKIKTQQTLYL